MSRRQPRQVLVEGNPQRASNQGWSDYLNQLLKSHHDECGDDWAEIGVRLGRPAWQCQEQWEWLVGSPETRLTSTTNSPYLDSASPYRPYPANDPHRELAGYTRYEGRDLASSHASYTAGAYRASDSYRTGQEGYEFDSPPPVDARERTYFSTDNQQNNERQPEDTRRRWTADENRRLAELANSDLTWAEIGPYFGRQGNACRNHFYRDVQPQYPWSRHR